LALAGRVGRSSLKLAFTMTPFPRSGVSGWLRIADFQVGFELLNGITLEQARKILGVLNENVVGVVVTTVLEVKTEAASG